MKTNIKWSENAKRKLADVRPGLRAWVQRQAEKQVREVGSDWVIPDDVDCVIRRIIDSGKVNPFCCSECNPVFSGASMAGFARKLPLITSDIAKGISRRSAGKVLEQCRDVVVCRAWHMAEMAAHYAGLSNDQKFLVMSLAVEIAQQNNSDGYRRGYQAGIESERQLCAVGGAE